MDLLVFAHPDNSKSHNAMVLKHVKSELDSAGKQYQVIDLYAEGFDPSLTLGEYWRTEAMDSMVKKYQDLIAKADRLVFIYPAWWYGPPAILKGFFDRVFTPGFAYNFMPMPGYVNAIKGIGKYFIGNAISYKIAMHLTPVIRRLGGKKAVVINTFGGEEIAYELYCLAPKVSVDMVVLQFCGIDDIARINWFDCQKAVEIPQGIKDRISRSLK